MTPNRVIYLCDYGVFYHSSYCVIVCYGLYDADGVVIFDGYGVGDKGADCVVTCYGLMIPYSIIHCCVYSVIYLCARGVINELAHGVVEVLTDVYSHRVVGGAVLRDYHLVFFARGEAQENG